MERADYKNEKVNAAQCLDNNSDVFMIGWGIRAVGSDGRKNLYPQFSVIDFSQEKPCLNFVLMTPLLAHIDVFCAHKDIKLRF